MELKQIKELMAAMEKAGMKKLSIKDTSGYELYLEKEEILPPSSAPSAHYTQMYIPSHAKEIEHSPTSSLPPAIQAKTSNKMEAEGKHITSPMVGTFYSAPSPDDPPFVKVGDRVDENTVVCIIEAMKVMNEIKAETSGVIAEVLADNGKPVQFGQALFRLR